MVSVNQIITGMKAHERVMLAKTSCLILRERSSSYLMKACADGGIATSVMLVRRFKVRNPFLILLITFIWLGKIPAQRLLGFEILLKKRQIWICSGQQRSKFWWIQTHTSKWQSQESFRTDSWASSPHKIQSLDPRIREDPKFQSNSSLKTFTR